MIDVRNPKVDIRAWGNEVHIANFPDDGFCGKLLCLCKSYRSSIHRHKNKNKTLHLLGKDFEKPLVYFEAGNDPENMEGRLIYPGESINVFDGIWHRFNGLEDAVFVEVSQPDVESERYKEMIGGLIPDFLNWKQSILETYGRK